MNSSMETMQVTTFSNHVSIDMGCPVLGVCTANTHCDVTFTLEFMVPL